MKKIFIIVLAVAGLVSGCKTHKCADCPDFKKKHKAHHQPKGMSTTAEA